MASAFSASKSTLAQLTIELEDSLLSIAKLEKKGLFCKARATKARRAVQREYDDYCNASLVSYDARISAYHTRIRLKRRV